MNSHFQLDFSLRRALVGVLVAFLAPFSVSPLIAQQQVFVTPEEAAASEDFQLQGEYAGNSRGMQVVAQGEGKFLVVQYRGGLPGKGWDGSDREEFEEDAAAVKQLVADLKLERVERTSPTLGAEPPAGAVVLFDGTAESLQQHWKEGAKMSDDGLLMQGCMSTDVFVDFTAHIEFRLPFMPAARGQGRGNSGAYYQGRYETQVLDSFGLAGKNNETGGIYEISDPSLNICLPPLVWQTYDVDFTAARWNDKGEKTANARLTVRLNGVTVQQNVEVPRITRAAPNQESPEPGPLYLQDHGNPVRYRNIWIVPRDSERQARRPRVPAFERFHASWSGNTLGGELLVNELGCRNCHQSLPADNAKSAPNITKVGSRARPEWIRDFIANPHAVKPGTTMPSLLDGWNEDERRDAVLKLTNFLVASGQFAEQPVDAQKVRRGEALFHEVGCNACHAPRNDVAVPDGTSVSLAGIENKYSVAPLTEFLKNPHAVRPSGRMPNLQLNDKESEDIANYLLKDSKTSPLLPNIRYQVFNGSWDEVPNFDEMEPEKTGEVAGFDVYVAGRNDNFGVRYEGFLHVEKKGKYRFHLGSDDGSKLYVNGKQVVASDGIHPHTVNADNIELDAGAHAIRVDYFEQGGQESLSLEVEGPGLPRQDAGRLLTPGKEKLEKKVSDDPNAFVYDPGLVEAGQKLFVEIGCAACHEYSVPGEGKLTFDASALNDKTNWANRESGCLAEKSGRAPNYDLSPEQLTALTNVLRNPGEGSRSTAVEVSKVFATFNCYACHTRDGIGGPEAERNALFTTTIPEMGDEGRLPPPLNNVGDKLNDEWLTKILHDGANERDYMRTRMPRFAHAAVDQLAAVFVATDRRTEAPLAEFDAPVHRVKSNGRQLVGEGGLACIKCHTFANHKATGIQAISLTGMTRRLRQDWFQRYLFDPIAYRPGTRMPTGFPDGIPAIKDVFDDAPVKTGVADRNSQPNQQISAIWKFLEDGDKASIPDGLLAEMIELIPKTEPVIYRNFLEGTSPRGIAVGYPEGAHIAWDANTFGLRMIWHGRFIDASKHWVGRGPGNQTPLGDHIMQIENASPLAVLESGDAEWPATDPRQRGYKFRGYELNGTKQPAFRYQTEFGDVTDFIAPVAHEGRDAGLLREITVSSANDAGAVYFLAAKASEISTGEDGWFLLPQGVRVKVTGGAAFIRDSGGQKELIVELKFKAGSAVVTQEFDW
ncbi:MAG: c-type cytochrome [Planctomycetaceae bacterium]|nr:c-type cytochrome [Planctomycetaceae bacterium]MCB9952819.1 c-type cytochrome [Planctomycetaceae bacterium]